MSTLRQVREKKNIYSACVYHPTIIKRQRSWEKQANTTWPNQSHGLESWFLFGGEKEITACLLCLMTHFFWTGYTSLIWWIDTEFTQRATNKKFSLKIEKKQQKKDRWSWGRIEEEENVSYCFLADKWNADNKNRRYSCGLGGNGRRRRGRLDK